MAPSLLLALALALTLLLSAAGRSSHAGATAPGATSADCPRCPFPIQRVATRGSVTFAVLGGEGVMGAVREGPRPTCTARDRP
jgi:hypothetical protein